MTLVAGIDSSTQSVKVAVHDAETGALVRHGSALHPDGTSCPPQRWWDALLEASAGLLNDVAAIAVAGQQHGMVALDDTQAPVCPALLWNDTRSAAAAEALVAELGASVWARAVGSVPVAAFTVTKLRWLAENEPALAGRVALVVLPHDYLSLRLGGVLATDRGDASGTGYWSPATGQYRTDLVRHAFGRDVQLPRVAAPHAVIGATPDGVLLGPGTGDNMAAALGLGLSPGDVVISLGTSGTAFAVSDTPTADTSGTVAGFADATGKFLPLACTLNAARVLTTVAALLGVDLETLADLALAAPVGAAGLVMLPYLDGERTPNLPGATGSLLGLTRANLTAPNIARAAVEGVLCGLTDAVDALRTLGIRPADSGSSAARQPTPPSSRSPQRSWTWRFKSPLPPSTSPAEQPGRPHGRSMTASPQHGHPPPPARSAQHRTHDSGKTTPPRKHTPTANAGRSLRDEMQSAAKRLRLGAAARSSRSACMCHDAAMSQCPSISEAMRSKRRTWSITQRETMKRVDSAWLAATAGTASASFAV
jgi:xylulokinase